MKQTILKAGLTCAAVAMLGTAVAQTGSSSSSQSGQSGQSSQPGQSGQSGSTSGQSSSSSSMQRPLSSTGLSSHSQQAVRASEVIGADVKGSSGSQIGQIEDVILNPTSGRVEFAVISRSGMGAGSSSSGSTSGMGSSSQGSTSSGMTGSSTSRQNQTGTSGSQSQTPGATGSSSSSTYGSTSSSRGSGQLIAVPWSLLRPDSSSSSGSSMSSTSSQMSGEQSFTLNVSESKLEQAPSLSRGSWSEISRPEFRQRVYSHFGVSSSSSTGGAESPYGSSSGSSSGSTMPNSSGSSGSQQQGSQGSQNQSE